MVTMKQASNPLLYKQLQLNKAMAFLLFFLFFLLYKHFILSFFWREKVKENHHSWFLPFLFFPFPFLLWVKEK